MRELKFKAWDKKNKKWVKWTKCELSINFSMKEPIFFIYDQSNTGYDDIEVVQFIGIYDKNENEISEDCILIGPFSNGENNKNRRHKDFKIEIKYVHGCYQMSPIGDIFKGDYRWFPYWKECEIIGSKLENPELLK